MNAEAVVKIKNMIENAIKKDMDELDFFVEAIEQGFTLKDFEGTEYYDYAGRFMNEHGLV